ncbi:unnamed protein product [Cyclocybe aegerita]|uniref:Uncharacterized protein n=1 Tax=Cyclocybe aegerita TaxID=1973307 RepID=A0A8S0VR86_CYCAE|nr:unnamed protein product [Cyclocybe aegerita]
MAFDYVSSPTNSSTDDTLADLRLYAPHSEDYIEFYRVLRTLLEDNSLKITVTNTPAEADLEVVLENGRYLFRVTDTRLTQRGFDRLFPTINPTPKEISSFVRGACHYYRELRSGENNLSTATKGGVVVEFYRLQKSGSYPPRMAPTGPNLLTDGLVDFVVQEDVPYGMKLINNTPYDLYPGLLYFDNSDLSIGTYYQSVLDTFYCPLQKDGGTLTIGYGVGPDRSSPFSYFLRDGQDLDIGFLKLVLSTEPRDMAPVNQTSPFEKGYITPPFRKSPKETLSGSIVVPVIQRRHPESKIEEISRKVFQSQVTNLQSVISTLRQAGDRERQRSEQERRELQMEVQLQEHEATRLASALDSEKVAKESLDGQVVYLKEQHRALEDETQTQASRIAELTTWLDGEREERAKLEADKYRVEEEYAALRRYVDRLDGQVADLTSSLEEEKAEGAKAEEHCRQLEEENMSLRGETEVQAEEIALLTKSLEEEKERSASLDGQLALSENQRRAIDEERVALQAETANQKIQLASLTKELEEQKSLHASVETELNVQTAHIASLTKDVAGHKEVNTDLEAQLARLEDRSRAAELERSSLQLETQAQKSRIALLTKELEEQKALRAGVETQLHAQTEQIASLTKEVADHQDQRRVAEEERSSLQLDTQAQKVRIATLTKELEEQRALRAGIETQLSKALSLDATSGSISSVDPRQKAKVRKGTMLTDTTRRFLGFRA